ncbi:SURF1 family protein [Pseudoalteromonas sp. MMG013]|uniref:SURF1 family protein n=1 Tax=Pseudoalteromonas sp. MMG013 TaxID=2822687 RepID=UPI001B3913D4|nr:SURF1 family protein [Pseudoalteromonas sp. MMG013]MBQ4863810.1 SURF1 family protein [Pseudoalteromonas sp. MMG013]
MQEVSRYKLSSILATLAVILIVTVCLLLARWQWLRGENKESLLKQEQAHLAAPRSDLRKFLVTSPDLLHSAKIKVVGHFVQGNIWFLDNKVIEGQTGYDVVTLFDANNLNGMLLVNLGFVAAPASRTLPLLNLPDEQIELNLQIKSKDIQGFTLASQPAMDINQPNLLQYIDLSYFLNITGLSIYPFLTYQVGAQAVVGQPHYQAVVMSPQKHQAYALQWLLIGISAAAIGYFMLKKKEETQ